MEVSLVSKRGVPEDAIISIRSGAVRRQGAVASDKPFRFPAGVSDADCVVKVDIMQNIGSGYLVMRPNQQEDKQYEVVMSNSSDMACELVVKALDASSPLVPVSPEEAAAAANKKQDAKAYLENTGLLPFVQGVLQVVAKQQPEDPFAAMAKHFLSASDEAAPPQAGSPKAAPAVLQPVVGITPAAEVEEEPAKAEASTNEAAVPASPTGEETKSAPPAEEQKVEEAAAPVEEKPAEDKPAEEQPTEEKPTEEVLGEEKPVEEAKPEAVAADEDKAESDHVDENKSDTLEEFTSKVNEASNAAEALAGAAAVLAGAPAGVAAAATEAANDAGEAAKAEAPAAGEAAAADESTNAES